MVTPGNNLYGATGSKNDKNHTQQINQNNSKHENNQSSSSTSSTNNEVISATSLASYFTPGALMADGISLFGSAAWESFYANGFWTFTKGGLTGGMSASISFVPELKLAISVMININSGSESAGANAELNEIFVPRLVEALQELQTAKALPVEFEGWLGSYGSADAPIATIMIDLSAPQRFFFLVFSLSLFFVYYIIIFSLLFIITAVILLLKYMGKWNFVLQNSE